MKKKTSYTIGTLIILLICAFVFVIVPAMTQTGQDNAQKPLVFGKYGKEEIKYGNGTELANTVSQMATMYQNYGIELNDTYLYYIFSNAFQTCVQRVAFKDFVKKTGYTVPQSAVNRQLRQIYSDENGNFSAKLYNQASNSEVQTYTKTVEQDLLVQRFYDDVFGGENNLYGLKESDAELDFLSSLNTNKRGFKAAIFKSADYPDEEKAKFGKENAAKFTQYNLSAITLSDKSTADKVATELKNGTKTFEDEVSEVSTKSFTDTEGKLINPYQYQIENLLTNKSDIDVLAKLSEGSVSDVIDLNGTFAIFKANSAVKEADFTNSEILRIVGNYISTYENSVIEDYFTNKAKEFTAVAKASTFENGCEATGITAETIAPFPLNYGNSSIADTFTSVSGLSGAESNENFLKTAFSLELNEYSVPVVLNNNVVVLQYTTAEEGEPSAAVTQIENFDSTSAQNAIMQSKKLKNNFAETYFANFGNNNN